MTIMNTCSEDELAGLVISSQSFRIGCNRVIEYWKNTTKSFEDSASTTFLPEPTSKSCGWSKHLPGSADVFWFAIGQSTI